MKTVLVTGGCGFIGSNFIIQLLALYGNNIFVINVDKITYSANLKNLSQVAHQGNYRFIKADICNRALIDRVFQRRIDYVIHFAAESHVDNSINDSQVFIKTNVLGTQVLLEMSLKYNVKKFIQISTDEVYGSLTLNGKELFTEDTPLSPRNPYSASKAGGDMLVMSYFHTHGLPAVITRCSNNYGPYQYPEKLIPKTIISAINEEGISIYGDGSNIRDWIHVQDHCRAIIEVMKKGIAGEIYNIGARNEISNIDIVRCILKYLDKSESFIQYIQDRPGHDRRYGMNTQKIKTKLGWEPKISFSDGIIETIEWYKDHQDWWCREAYL